MRGGFATRPCDFLKAEDDGDNGDGRNAPDRYPSLTPLQKGNRLTTETIEITETKDRFIFYLSLKRLKNYPFTHKSCTLCAPYVLHDEFLQ